MCRGNPLLYYFSGLRYEHKQLDLAQLFWSVSRKLNQTAGKTIMHMVGSTTMLVLRLECANQGVNHLLDHICSHRIVAKYKQNHPHEASQASCLLPHILTFKPN